MLRFLDLYVLYRAQFSIRQSWRLARHYQHWTPDHRDSESLRVEMAKSHAHLQAEYDRIYPRVLETYAAEVIRIAAD